jgi:SagB-type dehydrogenase family enzyme
LFPAPGVSGGEFRAHPLTRLEKTEDGWVLQRVGERVGYRVDTVAAAMLARAAAPVTVRTIVEDLAACGLDRVGRTLELLVSSGFLVGPDEHGALRSELAEWTSARWEAAAQYHFQTYGYEFEKYERDGTSEEDARRMHRYASEQPDTDRGKSYGPAALETRPLPPPEPGLAPEPVDGGDRGAHRLSGRRITALLSLLACPVQEKRLPWPGAEPALRRTSPSGGSRHPTEIYVRLTGVEGIGDGWWHIAARDRLLERIATGGSVADDVAGPQALVLYTCLFERNRYRYREPRTFRTVHMDIGHLMGTCELLATSGGFRAVSTSRVDGAALAAELGLDPLVECPMATTVIREGPGS